MLLALLINSLFSIFLVTDFNWGSVINNLESSRYSTEYKEVEGIVYPKNVLQIGDSLFFQTEKRLIEYDISRYEIATIMNVEENSLIDVEDEELYICSWENFLIEDPSEYATLIKWGKYLAEDELEGLVQKEIEVYRTVRPVSCGGSVIRAVNAYVILEPNFYEIDVDTKEMKIVEEFEVDDRRGDIDGLIISEDGKVKLEKRVENSVLERMLILLHNFAQKGEQKLLDFFKGLPIK